MTHGLWIISGILFWAGPAQEDDSRFSRGNRAMHDAAIAALRQAPDSFDLTLPERLVAFGTSESIQALLATRATSTSPPHRAAMARALGGYAGGPLGPDALAALKDAALHAPDSVESQACLEALETFGNEGREAVRTVAREAQTFHARFFAYATIVRTASVDDIDDLTALARGALGPALRRAGLPEGDPVWDQRFAQLRCDALLSWGHVAPDGHDLPLSVMDDPEVAVREAGLRVLGDRAPRVARPQASRLLEDSELPIGLRRTAVEVLAKPPVPDAAIRRLLEVAVEPEQMDLQPDAVRALAAMPAEQLHTFAIPWASPSNPAPRAMVALEILQDVPGVAVDAALERLSDHRSPAVRRMAVRALGNRGARDRIAAVRQQTRSNVAEVRAEAILALTKLQPTNLAWRESLNDHSKAKSTCVRVATAEALGFLGDRFSVEPLHRLAGDKDWRVRLASVESLAETRERSSIPFLIGRMSQERLRVRRAIAATLRRTTGMPFAAETNDWARWWNDVEDRFAVPPLTVVEATEQRRRDLAEEVTTQGTFFGLPVTSDRITFLIDLSASMNEPVAPDVEIEATTDARGAISTQTRLQVAQMELDQLLTQLGARNAQFNLVTFHSKASAWKRSVTPANRANLQAARQSIRRWTASGGTNLYDALKKALGDPEVDSLFVLSDGAPTTGEVVEPLALREAVRTMNLGGSVRIHTISVGGPSDLLRQLSEDSDGTHLERH